MIHRRFHGKRWRRRRRKRRLRLPLEEPRSLHIIIIGSRVGIRIVNYSSIEIVLVPLVRWLWLHGTNMMETVGNALRGVRGRSELGIVGRREAVVIRVWRVGVGSVIANEL